MKQSELEAFIFLTGVEAGIAAVKKKLITAGLVVDYFEINAVRETILEEFKTKMEEKRKRLGV